jgi:hypothetical protein
MRAIQDSSLDDGSAKRLANRLDERGFLRTKPPLQQPIPDLVDDATSRMVLSADTFKDPHFIR